MKTDSLYDRLKAIRPLGPASVQAGREDSLLVRDHVIPFGLASQRAVGEDMVAFLTGGRLRQGFDPGDLLFLDTETTGLSGGAGTVAFLIGLGRLRGDGLHITQLLMRDYHQERALIGAFLRHLEGAGCLVTYNGTGFDLPLLESRIAVTRSGADLSLLPHVDLLHAARRVFRLRLGRCSLARVEEMVFLEKRETDLPGAEVPERYFQYLRTRDEGMLEDVLEHNTKDILSLARLFFHLLGMHERPLDTPEQEDLFSLGRTFERQGQHARAAACYRACTGRSVRALAGLSLAEMLRRDRRDLEAASAFEQLRAGPCAGVRVYVSLAKIYEHRLRQPARALDIARQGMIYCAGLLQAGGAQGADYAALEHRALRLMKKIERGGYDDQGQAENEKGADAAPEGPQGGGAALYEQRAPTGSSWPPTCCPTACS